MRFALVLVIVAFGNIGCVVGRPVFVPIAVPPVKGHLTIGERASVVAKPPYDEPTVEASIDINYQF